MQIANPEVLDIGFDKKNNTLNASCDNFLTVRNSALGYDIHVLIDKFAYNYNNRARFYAGKFYFSELGGSASDTRKWNRKRAETYLGSIRHFLKASINNTLKQEGFIIHPIITQVDSDQFDNAQIDKKVKQFVSGNRDSLAYWRTLQQAALKHYVVNDQFLGENDLVKESDEPGLYELKFNEHIFLIANRKKVVTPNGTLEPAKTVLTLNTAKTLFDVNGIWLKPRDIIAEGEHTETIADLLPFDYVLSKKDDVQLAAESKVESNSVNNINYQFTEKLYVSTSRNFYRAGDTVWLSTYLLNARNNRLSNHSSKLYTELIDPENRLISRRILKLENGVAAGDFLLDDSLAAGTYRIRAYTNWIRNFGNDFVFEKDIEISSRSVVTYTQGSKKVQAGVSNAPAIVTPVAPVPLIRFYPESGAMVVNVYSRVAFTATDSCGNPLPVTGKIISSAGDSICAAYANTNGMGSFMLKPLPGLSYSFINKGNRTPFPSILPQGYVLFVQEKDSLFNVLVSTNAASLKNNPNHQLKLIIKHGGVKIAALTTTVKALQQSVRIPKKLFFPGVNVLSLEDAANRTLAERLVYCESRQKVNVALSGSKPSYGPDEKVTASLTVTDTSGVPVKGHMSVSVIPAGWHTADADNIVTHLLLSSEVKGKIINPYQYFDENNPDRKKELDLLLLTQGWRDYIWKYQDGNQPTTPIKKYEAEDGLKLEGLVLKSNGTPEPNAQVSLYIPGAKQQKLYTAQTDSAGVYSFLLDEVYGAQSFTLSATDSKGQAVAGIQVKSTNTDTLTVNAVGNCLQVRKMLVNKQPFPQSMEKTTQRLNEVKVAGRKRTQLLEGTFTTFGYPEENFKISPADYSFKNLKHYLLTRSRYAVQDKQSSVYVCSGEHDDTPCRHAPVTSKRPGLCPCNVPLTEALTEVRDRVMFTGQDSLILPKIFINNRQLAIRESDREEDKNAIYQQYLTLGMEEIESVKISKVLLTSDGPSKLGYLLYINLKPVSQIKAGKLNGTLDGYYQAKVFFNPDYKGSRPALANRTQELYWESDVLTGTKDAHLVSFYNSNNTGKYYIIVEGILERGEPFFKLFEYVVQ